MSALFGVFTSDAAQLAPGVLSASFARMRQRATGAPDVWRAPGVTMAVARHPWEHDGSLGTRVGVVSDGHVVVVADATLYYGGELRRRLERARVQATGESPAHLIAAAYRAWGDRCTERLEGDFAFVLWDRTERRVLAARDLNGTRPLHYAHIGGMLVVASTIGGVLAHPACPEEYDPRVLAETATGFFATDGATCYRAISVVTAGHDLHWRGGGAPRLMRSAHPPAFEGGSEQPFARAAEELRDLLTMAVAERLSPGGATSVTLSGGWDSTAVFACGKDFLRRRGEAHRLRPVSVSYPPRDPGREDELIEEVARFWKSPVHWISSDTIGFFGDAWANAAQRDEPFVHTFELWNRALARGSRAVDARVQLDGSGGDQLFQVSYVYLADMLRRLELRHVSREWREKGLRGQGFRAFVRWAMLPLFPPSAMELAGRIRGRPLYGHLDRRVAPWVDGDFARRHQLVERGRAANLPELRRGSSTAMEGRWYLTHPLFAKVFSALSEISLQEGVETRSPLLDSRIVRFAAGRPASERSLGRETKRLLRAAMKELLPESILAPRPFKTGTTSGLFDAGMRSEATPLIDALFRDSLLGEMGIISPQELRRGWERYLRTGDGVVGVQVYFTIQTEMWLRARNSAVTGQNAGTPVMMASQRAG